MKRLTISFLALAAWLAMSAAGAAEPVEGKDYARLKNAQPVETGKKIEVMTGEKKTHSVDLDDKNLVAAIDSGVTIGSRVRLTEEKDSSTKMVKVTVTHEK